MAFRTFTRTWWQDAACKVPGPGRRNYRASTIHDTEEGAREACANYNRRFATASNPDKRRGPRGLCMEFESC